MVSKGYVKSIFSCSIILDLCARAIYIVQKNYYKKQLNKNKKIKNNSNKIINSEYFYTILAIYHFIKNCKLLLA